jgi:hypothetical protein
MRQGIAGYLVGAVLAAAAAAGAWAVAAYERQLADVHEYVATGDYDRAAEALDAARPWARYVRWVPGLGRDVPRSLRTNEAAIRYWRGEYAALAGAPDARITAAEPDNVDLQLIVANAAYRVRQPQMRERMAAVRAIDDVLPVYLEVLKQERWREDAAYNYEFLARMRDDLARNRRQPPGEQAEEGRDPFGAAGAPSEPAEGGQFEIYIPLEREEREDGEAGQTEARPRRG